MRESIGGTWMFSIVILFIALFSSFLAYSISYTRAFNMKSEILNIIERNEGFSTANEDIVNMTDLQLEENGSTEALIFLKIKKMGYNYTAASEINCATVGHNNDDAMHKEGGYCLTKFCPNSDKSGNINNSNKTYYKVTTFIAIRIPVINVIVKVPVTGETRTLYFDSSDLKCS